MGTLLKNFLSGLLLAWLLVACGGGGGGGGSSDSGGVTLQPLVIDRLNALEVAGAVVEATNIIDEIGGGPIVPEVPGVDAAAAPAATPFGLLALIQEQFDRVIPSRQPAAEVQLAAFVLPPTPYPCDIDGIYILSGVVASDVTLTPGDKFTIDYRECDDGEGEIKNGIMKMVVVSFSGDLAFTPPYDYTVDVAFIGFAITEGLVTTTVDGDTRYSESVDEFNILVVASGTGTKLGWLVGADLTTLRVFRVDATQNNATGEYTEYAGGRDDPWGTLESTVLGGTVDFTTLELFRGVGDDFPYEGVMEILGAVAQGGVGPSSVTLIALVDSFTVILEVDEDGNGIPDIEILTNWFELTGTPPPV